MLVSMLTAMYVLAKTVEEMVAHMWWRQPEPAVPYMLSQPIPWQIHHVSSSRRNSRLEERRNSRKNSMPNVVSTMCTNGTCAAAPASPELMKAACTIQKEYRKYQQEKKKEKKEE